MAIKPLPPPGPHSGGKKMWLALWGEMNWFKILYPFTENQKKFIGAANQWLRLVKMRSPTHHV